MKATGRADLDLSNVFLKWPICAMGLSTWKGVHTDPDSPRGNLEVRTVQRNVFLPEMLIADTGCSVLPMGTEGADCLSPDWPHAAGTRDHGDGLLLPPPSSAAWKEKKIALRGARKTDNQGLISPCLPGLKMRGGIQGGRLPCLDTSGKRWWKFMFWKKSEMRSEGRRINILDSIFTPLCKEPYQIVIVSEFCSWDPV